MYLLGQVSGRKGISLPRSKVMDNPEIQHDYLAASLSAPSPQHVALKVNNISSLIAVCTTF